MPLIFKKKDYMQLVRTEMSEVKRLLAVFKVRTEEDVIEEQR